MMTAMKTTSMITMTTRTELELSGGSRDTIAHLLLPQGEKCEPETSNESGMEHLGVARSHGRLHVGGGVHDRAGHGS